MPEIMKAIIHSVNISVLNAIFQQAKQRYVTQVITKV